MFKFRYLGATLSYKTFLQDLMLQS